MCHRCCSLSVSVSLSRDGTAPSAAGEGNQQLQHFLQRQNPRQQHSSTLESYLIKPIQRILKYPLLLQQLRILSDPQSGEHHHLEGRRHRSARLTACVPAPSRLSVCSSPLCISMMPPMSDSGAAEPSVRRAYCARCPASQPGDPWVREGEHVITQLTTDICKRPRPTITKYSNVLSPGAFQHRSTTS